MQSRRGLIVIRERGIEVLSLTPGDADHEETDAAQHREDDEKQKEDRPTGRISATGDHRDTATGASEEVGDGVHGILPVEGHQMWMRVIFRWKQTP